MSKKTTYAALIAILVLALAALACGKTTTEKLAEAATPPTNTAEDVVILTATPEPTKATEKPDQPNPTKAPAEPTNTPKPTATHTPKPTPTPKPEDVTVEAFGFGQNEREIGYAFIVSNPNAGLAIQDTQYQVAAYDEAGAVVKTDSGYISLLLPSQVLGIGSTMFLDEGVKATKIEVQLSQGSPEPTDPIPDFEVSQVAYRVDDWSNKVTGVVANPFNRDLEDLLVSAVVYDEAGEIIGGGFTFLGFILANGTTGVEMSFTSANTIAKVEMYPSISGLTFLGTAKEAPSGAEELVLAKYGFGQDETQVGYGMLVENPNSGYAVESTMYHITVYDADGYVLAVDEGYASVILPGEMQGIAGEMYLPEGTVADHIDSQILPGSYEKSEVLPLFTSENVTYQAGDWSSKVTGMVVSPYEKDITDIKVSAIVYDDAGNIIGGGYGYLDFVPANGKAAAEVTTVCSGTPASAALYASVSALSDFK